MTPVALTIAGSDSGGGAGIQADLRTFVACGTFGATAITCLTAQNPDSLTGVLPVEPEFVREQMDQVARFFEIGAAKTGMLYSAEIIRIVAAFFQERPGLPLVVDPVMVSTSGATLLQPEAIKALREDLLPLAAVITPNLDEAAVLLGSRPMNRHEMAEAAMALADAFGRPVLLKGGHMEGEIVIDLLATPGGKIEPFEDRRIPEVDTHGSGCALSAAIAAFLARGFSLGDAVMSARRQLRRAMENPVVIDGRRFLNHDA